MIESLTTIAAIATILALIVQILVGWEKIVPFFRTQRHIISTPESSSSSDELREKLSSLHSLSKSECPFALVGSVYVDIILRPIATTKLGRDEWSNIDPIEFNLGGSTIWVGRFLWEDFQKKRSSIYSIVGSANDTITGIFQSQVANEPWLINNPRIGPPDSKTAFTVHLVQRNNLFTTMFTNTGVLNSLGWRDFSMELQEFLSDGGVLYISGYLKTNLCKGLEPNLRVFHEKALICMDHGRFTPNLSDPQAILALQDAFEQELIDVYFCTFKELVDFYNSQPSDKRTTGKTYDPERVKPEAILGKLYSRMHLPKITIVRSTGASRKLQVFAIVYGRVLPVKGTAGKKIIPSSIGAKNAFNAAFMYCLIHDKRRATLEEQVQFAATNALEIWRNHQS